MGADCLANNLHYHLVYADQMNKKVFASDEDNNQFPIEKATKKVVLQKFTLTQKQRRNKHVQLPCQIRRVDRLAMLDFDFEPRY